MTHDSMEFYSVYKSRLKKPPMRTSAGLLLRTRRPHSAPGRRRNWKRNVQTRISRLLIRSGEALFAAGSRLAGPSAPCGLEPGRPVI
jgi:hypothetical protein